MFTDEDKTGKRRLTEETCSQRMIIIIPQQKICKTHLETQGQQGLLQDELV